MMCRFIVGRNFRIDADETIINEMAVAKLGFETPEEAIGERIKYDAELIIVGVF